MQLRRLVLKLAGYFFEFVTPTFAAHVKAASQPMSAPHQLPQRRPRQDVLE